MCMLCLKNDIFGGRNPTTTERLKARAKAIKEMITEAESNKNGLCYMGDAAIALLKQEQFDLAQKL